MKNIVISDPFRKFKRPKRFHIEGMDLRNDDRLAVVFGHEIFVVEKATNLLHVYILLKVDAIGRRLDVLKDRKLQLTEFIALTHIDVYPGDEDEDDALVVCGLTTESLFRKDVVVNPISGQTSGGWMYAHRDTAVEWFSSHGIGIFYTDSFGVENKARSADDGADLSPIPPILIETGDFGNSRRGGTRIITLEDRNGFELRLLHRRPSTARLHLGEYAPQDEFNSAYIHHDSYDLPDLDNLPFNVSLQMHFDEDLGLLFVWNFGGSDLYAYCITHSVY